MSRIGTSLANSSTLSLNTEEDVKNVLTTLYFDFVSHNHGDTISQPLGNITADYVVANISIQSPVITAGTIVGSAIYIPTQASPAFSVDSSGNVIAASAVITGGKFGTATNYWSVGANGLTAVSGNGDVILNYGKTDFGQDSTNGFILGYDYSASKLKFEIGSGTTKLMKYDGTDFTLVGGTITGATVQTAASGLRIIMSGDEFSFQNGSTIYGKMYPDNTGALSSNGIVIESGSGYAAGTYLALSDNDIYIVGKYGFIGIDNGASTSSAFITADTTQITGYLDMYDKPIRLAQIAATSEAGLSAQQGGIYYDTTNDRIRVNIDGTWRTLSWT